jgi:hypothetical protein
MKTIWITVLISMAVCLSACTPAASEKTQPQLKTNMGDFVIASTRLADEVNGVKTQDGEKILLLTLTRPGLAKLDPSEFSLEAFDKLIHDTSQGEIYILGSDGSHTISTMAGWVDDEFNIGFRVPYGAKTYSLYWPGNPPIEIQPEE